MSYDILSRLPNYAQHLVQLSESSYRVVDASRPCEFGSRVPVTGRRNPAPGHRIARADMMVKPGKDFRESVLASAGNARVFDRNSKRTVYLMPEPTQDAEDDPLSPLMVILIVIAVLLVIIAIVQLF